MKTGACPRSTEAEAMRDQRLGPAELASFERHLRSCDLCSREVRILEHLAAPLRESVAVGAVVDELHVRRERARLLLAFDRLSPAPARMHAPPRPRAWQLAAAAVVLLAAGTGLWRARMGGEPTIAVHAGAAALWSGRTDGPHPRLVLERGSLFIRVENGASQAAPLRVVLPDGELEDIGTVFTVHVEAGHTARVSVREGSVLLRIHGESARVVRAGQTWLRDVSSKALARAPDTTASAPPAVAATAAVPPTAPAQAASIGAANRAAVDRGSVERPDPARDFGAAVALLEAGKNREAAAAFARFNARHRRDARAEDARYMRVLALQRAGSSVEVEAAARQYLRDYPAGLRRLEVEELLRR